MIRPTRTFLLGTALLCAAGGAQADGRSGITINPMLGVIGFDDNGQLSASEFGSLGLGYRFDSPFALELDYLLSQAEPGLNQAEVDIEMMTLDAIYHFAMDGSTEPYLLIGGGHRRLDYEQSNIDNSFVNAGLGVKVYFAEHLSIKAESRIINNIDLENSNYTFGIGLQYDYGTRQTVARAAPSAPSGPADEDRDGVPDPDDRCPGTAPGTEVDESGCELVRDADGDGVPDARDECPDTSAGAVVDARGCYIVITETREVTMNVVFGNNADQVSGDSINEIKKVADFMTQYPLTAVQIEGHTDDRGEAAYNQDLSQRRAAAVAAILVRRFGIDADRVSSIGYGESRPLVSNDTPENRARNRRVSAKVSATVESIQR